jgi:hypothetical protein
MVAERPFALLSDALTYHTYCCVAALQVIVFKVVSNPCLHDLMSICREDGTC